MIISKQKFSEYFLPSDATSGSVLLLTMNFISIRSRNMKWSVVLGRKGFCSNQSGVRFDKLRFIYPSVSLCVPSLLADSLDWLRASLPGEPGLDYPILSSPQASTFSCSDRVFGGYYADTEQDCQVFHICLQDSKVSMICPNGTVFSQVK